MEALILYQRAILLVIILVYFFAWLPMTLGVIFAKEKWFPWGIRLTVLAVALHGGWVAVRWVEVGHGPYINLYEVGSSDSIVAALIYLLAQWRYPKLGVLGVFVLPFVFLLTGSGVLSTKEPVALLNILDSSWLVVHVVAAKLALGSYLVSAILAGAFIFKARGLHGRLLDRFPVNPVGEELNRKFVTLGFLNHTVMLVSGSIWANVAFGSYWSWDPIETWALISWLIYGIFFHLITVHGWKGQRMAWLSLATLASILFAFFAVPYIFKGSHNLFL